MRIKPRHKFKIGTEVMLTRFKGNSGYVELMMFGAHKENEWSYRVCFREKKFPTYWQVRGMWFPESALTKVDGIIFSGEVVDY